MPRIRTIKPEFFDSPSTASASFEARLFFIALWCWADDYGVGTANPGQLIAFAFPNDNIETRTEFPRLRTEVADSFGVQWYEVNGRPFYAIPSWENHQKNERRAVKRNPPPDQGIPSRAEMRGSSVQLSGRSGTGKGTGEQGNRGKGTEEKESATHSSSEIAHAIPRPELDHLCNLLADLIAANGSKRPTVGKRWIQACRLLIDRDGRTVDQVENAIRWCQADEFWRTNILSMPKLREKYDQLRLAASRHRTEPQLSKAARNAAEYQRIFGGDHEHAGSIQALDAGVRA